MSINRTGKSQMLTAVNGISPRGVYVCGSYSSTTGLTVTLLKEPGSNDYILEAGMIFQHEFSSLYVDFFIYFFFENFV